jgi:hypothetical protein
METELCEKQSSRVRSRLVTAPLLSRSRAFGYLPDMNFNSDGNVAESKL